MSLDTDMRASFTSTARSVASSKQSVTRSAKGKVTLQIPQASHDHIKRLFMEYSQLQPGGDRTCRLPKNVSVQLNKDLKNDYLSIYSAHLLENRDWTKTRENIFKAVKKQVREEQTGKNFELQHSRRCWVDGCNQTSGNPKLLCNEHAVLLNASLTYDTDTNEYCE